MTEESEMKACWACYFERLYLAGDPPINCDPPSFVEKQAAVKRLKWGKAPGICGIHAELLKTGGNSVLVSLHAVLCSAWNTGIIPTGWKKVLVVPLWKGKGDRLDCNNYQGVTLFSGLWWQL